MYLNETSFISECKNTAILIKLPMKPNIENIGTGINCASLSVSLRNDVAVLFCEIFRMAKLNMFLFFQVLALNLFVKLKIETKNNLT